MMKFVVRLTMPNVARQMAVIEILQDGTAITSYATPTFAVIEESEANDELVKLAAQITKLLTAGLSSGAIE